MPVDDTIDPWEAQARYDRDAAALGLRQQPDALPSLDDPNDPYAFVRDDMRMRDAEILGTPVRPQQDAVPRLDTAEEAYRRSTGDVGELAQALTARQVVRQPNPVYQEAQDLAGAMRRKADIEEQAVQEQVAADKTLAEQLIGLRNEQVTRALIEEEEAQERERFRAIKRYEADQRMAEANREVDEASKALSNIKDFDMADMWSSKSTASKVLLILSAAFLGAAGRQDPFYAIRSVVEDEVNAHRMKVQKAESRIGAADRQLSAAERLHDVVSKNIADERVQDEIKRAAYYDRIAAEIDQMHAQHGLKTLTPAGELMKAAVTEASAEHRLRAQQRSAANPRVFVSSQPALSGEARKVANKLLDASLDERKMAGKSILDSAQARQEAEAEGVDMKMLAEYEKRRRPHEVTIAEIERFRDKYGKDIPGFWWGPRSDKLASLSLEARKANQSLRSLLFAHIKSMSGSQYTDREYEKQVDAMLGEWQTESEVLNGLDNVEARARNEASLIDRGFDKSVVDFYNRRKDSVQPSARFGISPSIPSSLPSERPR